MARLNDKMPCSITEGRQYDDYWGLCEDIDEDEEYAMHKHDDDIGIDTIKNRID